VSTKASVFYFVVCKLPLTARKLEADVCDLIPSPDGAPKPSLWRILKQVNLMERVFVSNHS